MVSGLASFLGCVADGLILDPFVDIANAVSYRSRGRFYELRSASAMPPILEGADRVTQHACCFFFVHKLVEINDFIFKFVVLVHEIFPFVECDNVRCSTSKSAEPNRIECTI